MKPASLKSSAPLFGLDDAKVAGRQGAKQIFDPYKSPTSRKGGLYKCYT